MNCVLTIGGICFGSFPFRSFYRSGHFGPVPFRSFYRSGHFGPVPVRCSVLFLYRSFYKDRYLTGTIPFLYRSFMKGTVMYRYLFRSNTRSFYKRNGTCTATRTVQYWSITDPWQRYRNGNFKGSSVPFRYRSSPFRSGTGPLYRSTNTADGYCV